METLSAAPALVVFGDGAEAETPSLLESLGARRVLLIAQARHDAGARRLGDALGERAVGVFVTDAPQVPGEVADAAIHAAREGGADWVLAHGGGTPIGVAKAVALSLPVRVAAVPTTYAGSERTDIWGITRDGRKLTGRDDRVRPSLVVYDPTLTLGLGREASLDSLFNALAHAVEALYARDSRDGAQEAARASLGPLLAGLRGVAADPVDRGARQAALRGAASAAEALGGAAMGLHHKLAHVLGGSFGTPHARTHAVLLPYVLGFNASAAPVALSALRDAFGSDDPPAFLYDLARSFGLATSLRSLGLGDADRAKIADEVLAARYDNPRALDRDAVLGLLDDALHDRRPSLGTRRMTLPAGVTGPHARLDATVFGAAEGATKVAVLGLHGRGASADRFVADLARHLGPVEGLRIVAPQAVENTWYPKGFLAPLHENQPHLDGALEVVDALYAALRDELGDDRVVLAGFSQGACLVLTWLSITRARPRHALAFTGAPTPIPYAGFDAARGITLHMGTSEADPWVAREAFEAAAARFRDAGAEVSVAVAPGAAHGIHAADAAALRAVVVGCLRA